VLDFDRIYRMKIKLFLRREIKIRTFRTSMWVVLAAAAIFVLALIGILLIVQSTRPGMVEDYGRLITFFDSGNEKTILSKAETITEALNEAGIEVDPSDTIEPAQNHKLIASRYNVNIYRSRPVIVVDGNFATRIITSAQTGRTIAQAAGIDLYFEDLTTIARETDILASKGAIMRVTVIRAMPVKLILYGQPINMRTQAKTVAEFIKEKGLVVGDKEYVIPSRDSVIAAGMEIRIWREGINTVTLEEDVDFEIQKILSNDQLTGFREVQTPGVKGKRSVTYEVDIRGGVEIGRKEIQSVMLVQPQRQVELIGIKSPVPAVPSNPGANAELGHRMMLEAGFGEDQWPCLYNLWMRESGWRTEAGNPYSGAYGIPQSLPASKMATFGDDYRTNPATQIAWGLNYIRNRYGTPCNAWAFFQRNNWY